MAILHAKLKRRHSSRHRWRRVSQRPARAVCRGYNGNAAINLNLPAWNVTYQGGMQDQVVGNIKSQMRPQPADDDVEHAGSHWGM